jgi:hypothetical protein
MARAVAARSSATRAQRDAPTRADEAARRRVAVERGVARARARDDAMDARGG